MLIFTSRVGAHDASREDLPIDFLMRSTNATEVPLHGLSIDDISTLVDEALPDRQQLAALTEDVYRSSAGNPLLVRQILAHLVRSQRHSSTRTGRFHPCAVYRIAGSHRTPIARVPGDQVEVLRTAAVVGVEFDLRLWNRSSPTTTCWRQLRAGSAAGLVEELGVPEHFCFAHATIRGALYDQMSSARRTDCIVVWARPWRRTPFTALGRRDPRSSLPRRSKAGLHGKGRSTR